MYITSPSIIDTNSRCLKRLALTGSRKAELSNPGYNSNATLCVTLGLKTTPKHIVVMCLIRNLINLNTTDQSGY